MRILHWAGHCYFALDCTRGSEVARCPVWLSWDGGLGDGVSPSQIAKNRTQHWTITSLGTLQT